MKKAAAILALLVGCGNLADPINVSQTPPDDPPPSEGWPGCNGNDSWGVQSLEVAIDKDMSTSCLNATETALAWWAAQGVGYLVPVYVSGLTMPEYGKARKGKITITQGYIEGSSIGITHYLSTGGEGGMYGASVTLEQCTADVTAHELGHALGLRHNLETGYLMYPDAGGLGWRLSKCELGGVL